MIQTQQSHTVHHGWAISIAEDNQVFYFECCPPGQPAPCDDSLCYATPEAALAAAYVFVEREIALLALIDLANQWFEAGLIDEDEYWSLTDFA